LKKLISLNRFIHLFEKGNGCLEKFRHLNVVPVVDRRDLYVLEGITEEDILAMNIMGAGVEEEYAFDAGQINPNGTTKVVMMIPGETQYRLFEISSACTNFCEEEDE